MSTLDVTIVQVTLPTLVRDLNTDFTTIQWVVLGYVPGGYLPYPQLCPGRRHVRQKTAVPGGSHTFHPGFFALRPGPHRSAGSSSSGCSRGTGAAFNQALGMALVTEAFPPQERGRALGMIGSVVSIGLAMGPAVGGLDDRLLELADGLFGEHPGGGGLPVGNPALRHPGQADGKAAAL